VNFFYDDTLQS